MRTFYIFYSNSRKILKRSIISMGSQSIFIKIQPEFFVEQIQDHFLKGTISSINLNKNDFVVGRRLCKLNLLINRIMRRCCQILQMIFLALFLYLFTSCENCIVTDISNNLTNVQAACHFCQQSQQ